MTVAPSATLRPPPTVRYPNGLSAPGAPLPPSHSFGFGPDALGRDLHSRPVDGPRTALLDQAAQGVSLTASVPLYRKAILAGAPWVPLYDPVQDDCVHPRITNFTRHPVWGFVDAARQAT